MARKRDRVYRPAPAAAASVKARLRPRLLHQAREEPVTPTAIRYSGQCHCGAIRIELRTDRPPGEQILGACQCSFCRKHNARTFSDPKAHVTLTADEPDKLQRYAFGLRTSEQVVCGRCGVYVAMTLHDGPAVWSVINIDTLDDRALFTRTPEPRDYSAEDRQSRIARRKARWTPTTLVGWPALPHRPATAFEAGPT